VRVQGLLLRYVISDPLLMRFDVIIVDEVRTLEDLRGDVGYALS